MTFKCSLFQLFIDSTTIYSYVKKYCLLFKTIEWSRPFGLNVLVWGLDPI